MSRNWTAACKIWKRCTLKKLDGSALNVCFIELPRDRTDDFLDFQMTQFVPRELTYKISGLPYNKDAMMEYRDVLKEKLLDPALFSMVCCEEKDDKIMPNIIASDSMQLIKRGDPCRDETPPNLKTKETKDYFRIVRDWNNLCPVPKVMEKFNIETFYDDRGIVTHQDYAGYGFSFHFSLIRRSVCESQGVPMSGAWMAAIGSEKAALRTGWEPIYEVSRKDLEKVLKVRIDERIPSYKFCVLNISNISRFSDY
ncbi:unnamed protein product [Chrysodeixis includens]|uniref:Uncharacterized protein n=1 Tax=Chrysodeixis includens TaxID=689277 RepID=A0A9P0FT64_CHRIL|nr:unnamed protein product [Chrysodeixis includens]